MHPKSNADQSTPTLVLDRLPSGEHAWLRSSNNTAEDDDALYVLTQSGRDLLAGWRAEEALFGPGLTVAEVVHGRRTSI